MPGPAPEVIDLALRTEYIQITWALAPIPIPNSNPLFILVKSPNRTRCFVFCQKYSVPAEKAGPLHLSQARHFLRSTRKRAASKQALEAVWASGDLSGAVFSGSAATSQSEQRPGERRKSLWSRRQSGVLRPRKPPKSPHRSSIESSNPTIGDHHHRAARGRTECHWWRPALTCRTSRDDDGDLDDDKGCGAWTRAPGPSAAAAAAAPRHPNAADAEDGGPR